MQKSAWPCSVRTTLDLDDELLAEAKALAARERLSLTRLIEQGLALRLRRAAEAPANAPRPSLPVHAGRRGLSAVLARRQVLVTFDRDFLPLLPSRQLRLLEG